MKRALAFVTICCLAATATAGLQFLSDGVAVTNGQTILVDPGLVHFSIIEDPGSCVGLAAILTGNAVFPPQDPSCPPPWICGWQFSQLPWPDPIDDTGQVLYLFCDSPVIGPITPRTLSFVMDVSGPSTLTLADENLDILFQVNYNIPEPATLALFGIGMVLLRRRNGRL